MNQDMKTKPWISGSYSSSHGVDGDVEVARGETNEAASAQLQRTY